MIVSTTFDGAAIPTELKDYANWVCWRPEERAGKTTKVPYSANSGRLADASAPFTWATFAVAERYALAYGLGVGFVFSQGDPFAGVDLDRCVGDHGALSSWAWEIVATLDSYSEVSPSGTGVKVLVRATLPPGRRRKGSIEMYDRARFFTITGNWLRDTPDTPQARQEAIATLHATTFPAAATATGGGGEGAGLSLSDADIIHRAMNAANGRKFAALWTGDAGAYGSRSEADAALCSMLAFWVGPDEARIAQLFRQSGLYREGKWERASYRDKTTALAVQGGTFYTPAGGAQRSTPVRLGGA